MTYDRTSRAARLMRESAPRSSEAQRALIASKMWLSGATTDPTEILYVASHCAHPYAVGEIALYMLEIGELQTRYQESEERDAKNYARRRAEINAALQTLKTYIRDRCTAVREGRGHTDGDLLNFLHDRQYRLEQLLDDLEREYDRRHWTDADYREHDQIISNLN